MATTGPITLRASSLANCSRSEHTHFYLNDTALDVTDIKVSFAWDDPNSNPAADLRQWAQLYKNEFIYPLTKRYIGRSYGSDSVTASVIGDPIRELTIIPAEEPVPSRVTSPAPASPDRVPDSPAELPPEREKEDVPVSGWERKHHE